MTRGITSNRHKGNAESEAANRKIDPLKPGICNRIYEYLSRFNGLTSKELERDMGMARSTVSARLSELRADKWILPTGERREGCAVLRAVPMSEREDLLNDGQKKLPL